MFLARLRRCIKNETRKRENNGQNCQKHLSMAEFTLLAVFSTKRTEASICCTKMDSSKKTKANQVLQER